MNVLVSTIDDRPQTTGSRGHYTAEKTVQLNGRYMDAQGA